MQVIKMKIRLLLVPVLLMCSFAAVAANGYVGFSVGSTDVKVDLTSLGGGQLDESTSLLKFYGGYRMHKYVAIEAAYFGLAEASVGQLGAPPNAVSGSVDMKALGLYGVAFVPLTKRTEVFVKAGGASWDADLQRDTTTASADGVDALYGLGISYGFTKKIAITADWEVIDSSNPEFSTFSLGFKWEFK